MKFTENSINLIINPAFIFFFDPLLPPLQRCRLGQSAPLFAPPLLRQWCPPKWVWIGCIAKKRQLFFEIQYGHSSHLEFLCTFELQMYSRSFFATSPSNMVRISHIIIIGNSFLKFKNGDRQPLYWTSLSLHFWYYGCALYRIRYHPTRFGEDWS